MDTMDLNILSIMQREPSLKITEIGERVGLSHTPCWRRIKQLEESGVITGRAILLDAVKLGLENTVFCFVKLKQHTEDEVLAFESAVYDLEHVVQCYSMSGEFDYVLRVVSSSVRNYESILKKSLMHLPNVMFVNSSFAMREIKNTNMLPLK